VEKEEVDGWIVGTTTPMIFSVSSSSSSFILKSDRISPLDAPPPLGPLLCSSNVSSSSSVVWYVPPLASFVVDLFFFTAV
jgi:hypothetical protein